jgi:hypothetical protein
MIDKHTHYSLAACLLLSGFVSIPYRPIRADDWVELAADANFTVWQSDRRGWTVAADVALDAADHKRLTSSPGEGVLVGTGGVTSANLLSRQEFQDVELQLEFFIPAQTNSGVKLNGLYEIQIRDSHGAAKPTGDDCGGVYPRATLGPRYKLLDAGFPPLTNAARTAGEWQTLEITFVAPRFDAAGKKVADARFVHVLLNGQEVQKDVTLRWPTGAAWNTIPEVPRGPLLLQGNHGPIAYRNIKIRPLP